MASFLDNSGDIILDAVLTDTGRKRLAEGNFKISRFALGDDEINYALYDKNHASGSAYYDLEILQTPVLESFTQTNASIQHGLLTMRPDLLYMPTLATNDKSRLSSKSAVSATGSIYYVAANAETFTEIVSSSAFADVRYALQANSVTTNVIFIESGMNTTELADTSTNRSAYIIGNSLDDRRFKTSVDNRFINGVYGPAAGSTFSNNTTTNTLVMSWGSAVAGGGARATYLNNYTTYNIRGVSNLIYKPSVGNSTDLSAISGPRGSITSMGFRVFNELTTLSTGVRSDLYTKYGLTDQTLLGHGKKYDYIDTIVYVAGSSTSALIQVPIRIIRYAGMT